MPPADQTPSPATTPLDEAKKKAIETAQSWATLRSRPALIFRSGYMSQITTARLHKALDGKHFENLDVIIDSPGGEPDAAFLMANVIRLHAKNVAAVVPLWAKSAATLISLSMDEIVVGELGQMGPLDTHVKTRSDRHWPKQMSALEIVRAMRETQKSALRLWKLAAKLLLEEEELTVHGSYQLAGEFVGHVANKHFSPIQLDQYGESVRNLEITKNYAKSLLIRFLGADPEHAEEIARRLVEDYASHGCVIDATELADIGLNARPAKPEEETLLHEFRPRLSIFNMFDDRHDESKTVEFLQVVMPSILPEPKESISINTSGIVADANQSDRSTPTNGSAHRVGAGGAP